MPPHLEVSVDEHHASSTAQVTAADLILARQASP